MTLSMQGSDNSCLTPQEIGDRVVIRELVDAYAYCAGRFSNHGPSSSDRSWRSRTRRVAVCGAPALCRLGGGARTVMTRPKRWPQ